MPSKPADVAVSASSQPVPAATSAQPVPPALIARPVTDEQSGWRAPLAWQPQKQAPDQSPWVPSLFQILQQPSTAKPSADSQVKPKPDTASASQRTQPSRPSPSDLPGATTAQGVSVGKGYSGPEPRTPRYMRTRGGSFSAESDIQAFLNSGTEPPQAASEAAYRKARFDRDQEIIDNQKSIEQSARPPSANLTGDLARSREYAKQQIAMRKEQAKRAPVVAMQKANQQGMTDLLSARSPSYGQQENRAPDYSKPAQLKPEQTARFQASMAPPTQDFSIPAYTPEIENQKPASTIATPSMPAPEAPSTGTPTAGVSGNGSAADIQQKASSYTGPVSPGEVARRKRQNVVA